MPPWARAAMLPCTGPKEIMREMVAVSTGRPVVVLPAEREAHEEYGDTTNEG